MFLSQPPHTSTPSIAWPLTAVSIASAITSRDTSEYFIASVPMPMPSVMVGTPNTCGIAPARFAAPPSARSDERLDAGVARIHGRVAVGDADDGLVEIAVAEADRAQHRAVGRARDALGDQLAALVERHGGTPEAATYNEGVILAYRRAPSHAGSSPVRSRSRSSLGPLAVRWYGLMYLVGFALVWAAGRYRISAHARRRVDARRTSTTRCSTAYSARILGGRLGYVLFYKLGDYAAEPWRSSTCGKAACRFTAACSA